MKKLKALSLFANVGLAETYLSDLGVDVLLANELLPERAKFYKHLYPNAEMICGDITDDKIRDEIVNKSKKLKIDFLIATPPCQGMSRHGKQDPFDPRNYLIYYVVDVIKKIKPKFILLENVTKVLSTKIIVDKKQILIPDYLRKELESDYIFPENTVFSSDDYGVPQSRKRCIYRLVRKDLNITWPQPQKQRKITLRDAIGNLPSLDPLVREIDKRTYFPDFEKKRVEGLKVSKWHYPPVHSWKHILWMMHTPSGKSALYNKKFFPVKDNGEKINGRLSCYRRFDWDRPANTITQNNGVISSACCVHPGRKIGNVDGENIYSDPRVLSIYELMIVSSLPLNWNIPEWADEKLIRNVIGEGIPPLMVKCIVGTLIEKLKEIKWEN